MASLYRKLIVWQKSFALTQEVYVITKTFPKEELYGLTSQIRRSAVSIPSNIAEGSGRGSDSDYARFLGIAKGSCCELETQILLAHTIGYIENKKADSLLLHIEEILKMLTVLSKKLKH